MKATEARTPVKSVLLLLGLAFDYPEIGARVAALGPSPQLLIYAGLYALLAAALWCAAFVRSPLLRWGWASILALAALLVGSFQAATADAMSYDAFITMIHSAGFAGDAAGIRSRWEDLLRHCDAAPEPEYHRCYPDDLLKGIAAHALRGVGAIGCRLAAPATADAVHGVLNQAWTAFWSAPEAYADWERRAVAALV